MSSLEIRLLGRTEFRLIESGHAADLRIPPQQVALLVYLALAGPRGGATRDELVGVFWPERSEERARAALSQALYRLRSALPDEVLHTSGNREVILRLDADHSDVVRFDSAMAEGQFEVALEAYGGQLAPGFHLGGAGEFHRWLDEMRERLSSQAVRAAGELAAGAAAAGNLAAQARWLERALSLRPYDEQAAAALVHAIARAGDVATALTTHQAFAHRLRKELEIDPSPEFLALRGTLRHSRVASRGTTETPRQPTDEQVLAPFGNAGTTTPPPPTTSAQGGSARRPRARRFARLVGGVLVTATAATGIWAYAGFGRGHTPAIRENRVLVSALQNETADSTMNILGRMAADWITRELIEIGGVEVVREYGGLGEDVGENGASVRELARAAGAGLYVTGSVRRSGDSLLLETRIDRVSDAAVVRTLKGVTVTGSDTARAIGQLAEQAAGALATHLDPRLTRWSGAASQPPNLEAYRLFVQGLDQFLIYPMDWNAAQASFLQAFSRDSVFNTALLWALYASHARGDWVLIDSLSRFLDGRRRVLTSWEHAFLDAQTASWKGDDESSLRSYKELLRITPQSEWAHNAGMAAHRLNRQREAADLFRSNDPPRGWMRDSPFHGYYFTRTLHLLGEHEEELTKAREWVARFPTHGNALAGVPKALVALGRIDEAMAFVDSVIPISRPRNLIVALPGVANELIVHGHEPRGLELYRVAAEISAASGDTTRLLYPQILARGGYHQRAQRILADIAMKEPRNVLARGELAVVSVKLEDTDASAWLAQLELPAYSYFRARVLATLGETDAAVDVLLQNVMYQDIFRIHATPDFRTLSSHPGFRELMRPKD